ncbi:hypothetical protein NDU88_002915 [Pleurodeles waltl]|uniref:Uncharacterized protein n=1 Tax=Pleurodeles waltl TaxID=8319 RepID=A0AAV7TM21_PLEWA|nr:hypothetical protein NDU88_002915 [Pleurodeles waltl]
MRKVFGDGNICGASLSGTHYTEAQVVTVVNPIEGALPLIISTHEKEEEADADQVDKDRIVQAQDHRQDRLGAPYHATGVIFSESITVPYQRRVYYYYVCFVLHSISI